MDKEWFCYQKVGSCWETVLRSVTKAEAEAWVAMMRDKIRVYDRAISEAKKAGTQCRIPDPGFREPHCVPV